MSRERVRAPLGLLVLGVIGFTILVLPPLAVALEVPWGEMGRTLRAPAVLDAVVLSLACTAIAVAVATVLGVPLAWLLARVRVPGVRVIRAVCALPLVLPPVVAGIALLLAFGPDGLLGSAIASTFGRDVPTTTVAVVIAATFVALPFIVLVTEAGLRAADVRLEEVAATLGASPWTTLRRVTLPAIARPLGAGVALAWARALGEFGATITFAGDVPGATRTLPLAVYAALDVDPAVAYVLSALLALLALVLLVALSERQDPA